MKRQTVKTTVQLLCTVNCQCHGLIFERTVLRRRRAPTTAARRGRVGLTAARHRQTGTRAAAAGPPRGAGGGIADWTGLRIIIFHARVGVAAR